MYRLEYIDRYGRLKTLYFVEGEELEMGQYKKNFELEGYIVTIWTIYKD